MRILVDFDSTLTQMDEHMLATCNERHGTEYAHGDIDSWEWLATFPHASWAWGDECFGSPEWQASVPPQPGAVRTVRELAMAGDEPYIVSDRTAHTECIREWAANHGLGDLPVIISDRNDFPKWKVARGFGIRMAIEDAPHNALDLADKAGCYPVILIDKPYNRDIDHPRIVRVANWDEVALVIELAGAVDARDIWPSEVFVP